MKQTLLFLSWLVIITNCEAQHTIEIKHKYYTVQFDTVFCQGILNDYWQTTAHYNALKTTAKVDRKTCAAFTQDPLVPKRFQIVSQSDYNAYNKETPTHKINVGHIVPFEAMAFDQIAAKETMYFGSNTSFQDGFENQHQWAFTEKGVLDDAATIDSIHVYTGVLISLSHPKKYHNIFIGDYYFKIEIKNGVVSAWLAVNDSSNTSTKPSDAAIPIDKLKDIILQYYPQIKLPF
jgi:DNA/RNA endonuclease G (NUC1)